MTETDLRPPEQTGFRPQQETGRGPPRPWWLKLPAWAGFVILCALLGAALGYYQGKPTSIASSTRPLLSEAERPQLSESERPQRLEAMRAAVAAFYAQPNDDTQKAARAAVLAYRQAFADALPVTLQAPTEKLECNEPPQVCDLRRRTKKVEDTQTLVEIFERHREIAQTNPEFFKQLALDYAMDRRVDVNNATATIDVSARKFRAERELTGHREKIYQALDKAARGESVSVEEVGIFFKLYADAAERSFKPIRPGRYCPLGERGTPKDKECEAASIEINEAIMVRDRAVKIAVAKKALVYREAPLAMLTQSVLQVFGRDRWN